MKYTKKGPCEHFDMEADKPLKTCIQDTAKSEGEACWYWMENHSMDDVFAVCRERTDVPEDTQTVGMFLRRHNDNHRA